MGFCSTLPSCVSLACAPPRLSQGLMHAYQLRTQEGEGACVCVCVCGLPEQLAPHFWAGHDVLEVKQESQNIKAPRTWKRYNRHITQARVHGLGGFESPKLPSFSGSAPQQCTIPGPGSKAAEHPQTQDLETLITQACGSCLGHFESLKLPSFSGRAPQQCTIPGPGTQEAEHPEAQDLETFITQACGSGSKAAEHPPAQDLETFITQACGSFFWPF